MPARTGMLKTLLWFCYRSFGKLEYRFSACQRLVLEDDSGCSGGVAQVEVRMIATEHGGRNHGAVIGDDVAAGQDDGPARIQVVDVTWDHNFGCGREDHG